MEQQQTTTPQKIPRKEKPKPNNVFNLIWGDDKNSVSGIVLY
jgi:hypothetical protein